MIIAMMDIKKELAFVDGDDWVALYINGEMFEQNHSIDTHDWMEVAAGCTLSRYYGLTEKGTDGLYKDGRFPERLDKIPEDWLEAPEVYSPNSQAEVDL